MIVWAPKSVCTRPARYGRLVFSFLSTAVVAHILQHCYLMDKSIVFLSEINGDELEILVRERAEKPGEELTSAPAVVHRLRESCAAALAQSGHRYLLTADLAALTALLRASPISEGDEETQLEFREIRALPDALFVTTVNTFLQLVLYDSFFEQPSVSGMIALFFAAY